MKCLLGHWLRDALIPSHGHTCPALESAYREQMSRVQGELDVLSRENELLKEKRQQEPCRPPPLACDDPLAEQVPYQMNNTTSTYHEI